MTVYLINISLILIFGYVFLYSYKSDKNTDKIVVQDNSDAITPRVIVFPQTEVSMNNTKNIIGKAYIKEIQGTFGSGCTIPIIA